MVVFSLGCDALIILALSRARAVAVLATGDGDAGGVSAHLLCIAVSIGATPRSSLNALRLNASLPAWALAICAALRGRLGDAVAVDARFTSSAVRILCTTLGRRDRVGGGVGLAKPLSIAVCSAWAFSVRRAGTEITRFEITLGRLY